MKNLIFAIENTKKDPFEVEYQLQKDGLLCDTSKPHVLGLYMSINNQFTKPFWDKGNIIHVLRVLEYFKKWKKKQKILGQVQQPPQSTKNKNAMTQKKMIKRNNKKKIKGFSEKTIQNMTGYFFELNQLLTKTNGHLEPSDNYKLQRKYKVSFSTLSIAKKLGYVDRSEIKKCKILKEVNRPRAIRILNIKYGDEPQKYPVVSISPFLLKGIYTKKGNKSFRENRLLTELSTILSHIFKFDKRYQNSFKPVSNVIDLEESIIKYKKILETQNKKRGITDSSIQPSLFDVYDSIDVEKFKEIIKTERPKTNQVKKTTQEPIGFYNGKKEKEKEEQLKKEQEKEEVVKVSEIRWSHDLWNHRMDTLTYEEKEILLEIESLHLSILNKIEGRDKDKILISYVTCNNILELELTYYFLVKVNQLLREDITESYVVKGFKNEIFFIKSQYIVKKLNQIGEVFGKFTPSIITTKDKDNPKRKAFLFTGSFESSLNFSKKKELLEEFKLLNKIPPYQQNNHILDDFDVEKDDMFSVSIYVDFELYYDGKWEGCTEVVDPLNKQEPIVRDYAIPNTKSKPKTYWIVQEKRILKNGPISHFDLNMEYIKWWRSEEEAIIDAHNMAKINPGKNYFVSMVTDIIATEIKTVQKNVDISTLFELEDEDEIGDVETLFPPSEFNS
jgi:hypothetical protein